MLICVFLTCVAGLGLFAFRFLICSICLVIRKVLYNPNPQPSDPSNPIQSYPIPQIADNLIEKSCQGGNRDDCTMGSKGNHSPQMIWSFLPKWSPAKNPQSLPKTLKLQKNWDSHDDDLDEYNDVDGYRPNQINVNALHGKSQNATYITVHCTLLYVMMH